MRLIRTPSPDFKTLFFLQIFFIISCLNFVKVERLSQFEKEAVQLREVVRKSRQLEDRIGELERNKLNMQTYLQEVEGDKQSLEEENRQLKRDMNKLVSHPRDPLIFIISNGTPIFLHEKHNKYFLKLNQSHRYVQTKLQLFTTTAHPSHQVHQNVHSLFLRLSVNI